ncbi:hypothetical protein M413DRAFT_447551 [Hebeloma cylindrosporum]|uniref:Peptidase A1 domain-containing protein n=1 Tax=Hebeloma cylindrosporum TaxID=76867 RepID=A0A0C3C3J8_HEBCY|nr:hypothetical protein M413DRAFT_447551 [Hebeloma cylindrosporum h7]
MKGSFATFGALFLVLSGWTDALKVPFQKRAPRGARLTSPRSGSRYSFGGTQKETLGNIRDFRYVANITINNVEVQVAIDTGSTDLWVIPPNGIGEFNDTGIAIELLYGDGSYGTKGTIGVSPFQFGTYHIDKQAFMDATSSIIGGMQEEGIYGLMGLSFDFSTASPINRKIKALYGNDATWGRSVLQTIFAQNASEPNFIAIDLARTDDLEDTGGGSLLIGAYDDKYAAVAQQPKLPQYPKGGDRWTTLLEGISVGGKAVAVQSTIPGVPAGSAQALLDTGDPSSIFPVSIHDAIYSSIPGAALYSDDTGRTWIIPCNTTTEVELQFGGEKYAIHPLDLSTISDPLTIDGKDWVACVATFKAADNWGEGDFDLSLGDTFLRNVYAVFDFGDTPSGGSTQEPFMQLLSQIDSAKAVAQVASIRGKTMSTLPPEMDPATLVGILMAGGGDNPTPTATDVIGAPTSTGVNGNETRPGDLTSKKGTNLVSGSDGAFSYTIDDETVKKYGLIVICLLGANLLIGLILLVFGVLGCIRRGSSRAASTRTVAPHYVPVKSLDHDEAYTAPSYQKQYS